jgi:trehalose 6-phosphate phosphatase
MSLPILRDARAYGFFFDFDGTLAELAETPGGVFVEDRARQSLGALFEATAGAVAIVTGREIETIDAFLTPLKLPAAGVHGFERRKANGDRIRAASSEGVAQAFESIVTPFANNNIGLFLEKKRGAVALHYRLRPDLESSCIAWMEDAASRIKGVVLTRGKMVVEARFHQATKGTAIRDFHNEPPFQNRIPLFAGDDATDEDGFETVNGIGGVSIKVGPGVSTARYRVRTVGDFLSWLDATAKSIKELETHG